jgi:glycopeptide antibiotics resistance protein
MTGDVIPMMLKFVPYPLLIGIGILVVILFMLWRHQCSRSYLFFFSIFWIYLLALVGATLFPIPIINGDGQEVGRQSAAAILSRVNLVPFDYSQYSKIAPSIIFFREILANILMTVPFGFGISFVARVKAKQIPWLALALGFGIETAQLGACLILGIDYRGVDISDSLLNALGVLCGYGCFFVFRWGGRKLIGRLKIKPGGLIAFTISR